MGKTLNGLSEIAAEAEKMEAKHCGDPLVIDAKCRAVGDKKCFKAQRCEVALKTIITFRAAVLTAKRGLLETGATKETTQALIQAALKSYGPVKKAMEAWR
jgi:hypothetical protein